MCDVCLLGLVGNETTFGGASPPRPTDGQYPAPPKTPSLKSFLGIYVGESNVFQASPPNRTGASYIDSGTLHPGHAEELVLQDLPLQLLELPSRTT